MSAPWLPTPRPPLDDELAAERAVAAAVTVHDRRQQEAVDVQWRDNYAERDRYRDLARAAIEFLS